MGARSKHSQRSRVSRRPITRLPRWGHDQNSTSPGGGVGWGLPDCPGGGTIKTRYWRRTGAEVADQHGPTRQGCVGPRLAHEASRPRQSPGGNQGRSRRRVAARLHGRGLPADVRHGLRARLRELRRDWGGRKAGEAVYWAGIWKRSAECGRADGSGIKKRVVSERGGANPNPNHGEQLRKMIAFVPVFVPVRRSCKPDSPGNSLFIRVGSG